MAIDIIARGLAASLIGSDGKISSDKMPIVQVPTSGSEGFTPIGNLTSVDQIAGKTVEEIMMIMLFGIMQPTITIPKFQIQYTGEKNLIAYTEQIINGYLIFDRGEIRVPNGVTEARAGAPTYYTVNGQDIASTETEVSFSLSLTPTLGENVVTASVTFEEGPQPVDSLGNPFDAPYPAGTLTTELILNGISSLTTENDSPIEFQYFEAEDGEGYQAIAAAETDDLKQSFKLLAMTELLGIKQFNPLSQVWEWIGGSAEASLKTFDTTIIQGATPEETYIVYVHNGSIKGQRELRLYITLN